MSSNEGIPDEVIIFEARDGDGREAVGNEREDADDVEAVDLRLKEDMVTIGS